MITGMLLISGCSKKITYNPNDFINPNREIVKTTDPDSANQKLHTTFGIGNDPAVRKAYDIFIKKGEASTLRSKGFDTFAYDANTRPIIACAPLHLCIMQLEQGERINNIDLGDAAHWMVSTSFVGSKPDGSYQIAVKPKLYDVATDLVISTDKRTYNIGLVSKKGETTHIARFYYPEESLQEQNIDFQAQTKDVLSEETVVPGTAISLNNLNFNYVLQGSDVVWHPTRVFDDGTKTFIEMPPISERMDLPVLYILKNQKMALVNYRYKRPYYIVDGLFEKAFLISGKDDNQLRVEIDNKNLR